MPAGLRCTQLLPQASLLALLVLTCATFFGPLRAAEDPIVLPDAGSAALGPDDTLELTLTAQALGEEGLKRAAFGATNPALHAWLLESGQAPAAGNSGDGRAFVWPSPTRLGEWLVHLRGLDAPRTGPDAPKAWDLLLRWTWPDAPGGEVRLKQAVRFRVGLPDVVLLLDGSLSMGRNDPQRLRVEAARTFVNLALRSGGIGRVAVVQFDDKPRLLLPLTPVAERGRFELTFSELRELGMTDINGGIRTAVDLLAGREAEARAAVVLLTDGKQEPGEYAEAHQAAKQAGIPIHTVALGQSADRALLQRIAADTGGTCSDAESGQDLLHLYGTIAGRILGGRTLCEAALEPGAAGAGFPVDGSIRSLAASAKSEAPGALLLKEPAGHETPSEAREHAVLFRQMPPLGAWLASWSGPRSARFEAAAQTPLYPLFFRARPHPGAPVELDPDDPRVALSLAEGIALQPGAAVRLELAREGDPGALIEIQLHDDGRHGDGAPGDGVFAADLPEFAERGWPDDARGTLRILASGARMGTESFRREAAAPWILRRSGARALAASGPLDLGTHWSGSDARGLVALRLRGPGGALQAELLPAPEGEGLLAPPAPPRLDGVPASLEPRQPAELSLSLALPEGLAPGRYGGTLRLRVAGAGREPVAAEVPWRVEVRAPELRAEPLDLGALWPGQRALKTLRLATRGGRTRLLPFELRANKPSPFPLPLPQGEGVHVHELLPALKLSGGPERLAPLDAEGAAFELAFEVSPRARAGALDREILVRDFDGRELGRIPLRASVRAMALIVDERLDFGVLEPGDLAERDLVWTATAPADILDALPPPRLAAAADRPEEAAVEAAAAPRARLKLTLSERAAGGPLEGGYALDFGPALARGRWHVEVIPPKLSLDPLELDFGSLLPGQLKLIRLTGRLTAARSVNLTLRVPHPPAKPRFEATAFPEGAFALSAGPEELGPGQDAGWEARLAVPESAEDGLYATALLVRSRLGEQRVPVRVRVVSPIPIPPFHVTPTALTLRIVDGIPEPASRVVVTSHRDHDLPLSALVRPGAGYAQGCGVLLDEAGLPARAAEWNLPGRGQLSLYVRAHPDAVHEEFGALVLRAEQEEQAVALAIEKVDAAPKGAGLPQPGGLSYFDWLRLLLLLILLLLVLLIRALLRKRWVRYLAYACLLHAAFFLIAVPPGELVAALPDSVQLTLLQAEEQWSGELSPEQQRRLDELGATADAGQAGAKAAGSGMEAPGGGAPELAGDLLQAADAAPAAAAAMQDPRLEEQRPGAPAPETQRAEPAQPVEDRPLSSEPLEVPAPARPAPAPEPRRAPEAGSVAAASAPEFPALTAPLATPERQPAAAAALADPRPAQPAQPAAASRPAESRPTREAPAASDAPLVDAPLVANPVAAPRPATPDAQVPTAPARANASALLDENIEPVVAAPDGADSAHSAQPAQPAAAAAPGQPSTPVNWGAALAQGGRARGGADARVAGGLAFGDGTDVALDAGPLAGGAGSAGAARKTGGANGTGNHPAARGGGAPSASGIGGAGAGRDGLAELGRAGQGDRSAGPRAGRGGLGELDGAGFGSEKFGPGAGAGDGLARGAREDGAGLGDAPLDLGGSGAGAKPGPGAGQGAAEAGAGPGRAHAAGSGLGYAGEGPGAGGLAELGALGGTGGAGGPRPERGAAALDPDLAWRPAFATDPGLRGAFTARETGSRPLWGYPRQAALRLTLGLARHGGDWNSSPTALYHLATAFRERCGLPDAEVSVRQVELDRAESLAECRVVLMTSNEPIPFTPRQERALAAYLKQGGTLWVNDSSASEDERFDTAFRAMLARALPERGLERLPPDHPYFRAAYDLTPGYKGYRIPPGDKYREEHLRGVVYPSADGRGRLALLYTRNDYADGLEIDPRMTAGRMSLTDLTPDEMLEGSLRFGINLLALALGAEAPVFPRPPEGSAEALKLYRYHGPPLRVFDDFVSAGAEAGGKAWRVEEWSNPAAAEPAQAAGEPVLRVRFKGGDKMKAAVGRAVELNLAQARALVLDLHSGLPNGFNVALLLQTGPDWSSFETRPVYVRPGWNRGIRFPLDLDDFKSDKTEWKAYDTPFRPREQVVRVVVLLYNLREDGTVLLKDLRIEK